LPDLPDGFNLFLRNPKISAMSHLLNVVFSFTALECTHQFPTFENGPPAFVTIAGQIYHCIWPSHLNSVIKWFLYDGFLQNLDVLHSHSDWARTIPPTWIHVVANALITVNPFACALQHMSSLDNLTYETAHITLDNEGTGTEIAAILSYGNAGQSNIQLRHDTGDPRVFFPAPIPVRVRVWVHP
jgi:hypothetical protein